MKLITLTRISYSALVALMAALFAGCTRPPDPKQVLLQSAQAIDQYLHTNAAAAEAIMLQQERYFRDAEKAGYRGREIGIELNSAYAMTYSRLYLVEKALGKSEAAQRYYQLAAEYWPKANKADRHPESMVPQTIREQIEGVNRYFGSPDWETHTP